jgi:glycosyltransferase involved in cell wall biosynthesis
MPVHGRADPAQLVAALDSLTGQTLPAAEIVVVHDDPIPAEQDEVLARYRGIRRVAVPAGCGVGYASARGLEACRHTWVARADADDINEPHRFERQLAVLEAAGADVCSAAMVEFLGTPDSTLGVRSCPVRHDDFARRMRTRNPVHQPAVVFRRQLAMDAGGYAELGCMEDYDLWARMLRDGASFVGTDEVLVRYRTDGMLQRRSAKDLHAERDFQRRMVDYGLIGPVQSRINRVVRGAYLRLPTPVLERAYQVIFRR